MTTIYTFGYIGSSPGTLESYVDELGAMLVDIRYAPYSKNPVWRASAVRDLVGAKNYVWVQDLGNINYKTGGDIRLMNAARGVERLRPILAERDVILMCACVQVETCHRLVAANILHHQLGLPIEHLKPRKRSLVENQ